MKNKHDPTLLKTSFLSNEIVKRTPKSHETIPLTFHRPQMLSVPEYVLFLELQLLVQLEQLVEEILEHVHRPLGLLEAIASLLAQQAGLWSIGGGVGGGGGANLRGLEGSRRFGRQSLVAAVLNTEVMRSDRQEQELHIIRPL
jgi:hypothetical protein